MAEPVILTSVQDGIAELTLNRPKALNALNTEMVVEAYKHYSAWSAPGSGVKAIILRGTGNKAFCAGGDVKHVALQVAAGRVDDAMAFFKAEYLLDGAISTLGQLEGRGTSSTSSTSSTSTSTSSQAEGQREGGASTSGSSGSSSVGGRRRLAHVALLDGITMGGGAGVSMHGAFRVATERTVFAMPECAIGLFPDVGMMAVLPRLPNHIGAYLALTGARLTGNQLKEAGLATHFIHSSHLPRIKAALLQAGDAAADLTHVNTLLASIEADSLREHGPPRDTPLFGLMPVIGACFRHLSVGEVVAALRAEKAERPWCEETLQQLQRGSPLSAAITLAYYQRAKAGAMTPLQVLEQDCLLCGHFMAGDGDFYEGVRARLIDKDDAPAWKHASHAEVPGELVRRFFLPKRESDVINLQQLLAARQPGAPPSRL